MPDTPPTILLIFANDRTGGSYLRALTAERRAIVEALDVAEGQGRCRLVVESNATHAALFDRLDEIGEALVGVHFGGHAEPDGLRLEDEDGHPVPARMAGIAERLSARDGLRWIFLNGCGTEPHVDLLHRRVPVPVIATDRAVRDRVAADFARRFYHALGAGESIAAAFDAARSEIHARHDDPSAAIRPGEVVRMLRPATSTAQRWPWVLVPPTDDPRSVDWRLPPPHRRWPMLATVAVSAALAVAAGLALATDVSDAVDPPDAVADAQPTPPATLPEGFVEVPAGRFLMGSPPDEAHRDDDEGPQHVVIFERPLWVQTHEVSQGAWYASMGNRPGWPRCDDCPVGLISWYDAAAYANARSRAEGLPECHVLEDCAGEPGGGCPPGQTHCLRDTFRCRAPSAVDVDCPGYRLPTEAEWEYFARAGTTTAHPAGTTVAELERIAWFQGNHHELWAAPRGTREPNAWGLFDVLGSHGEWCADRYGPYPADSVTDPTGPSDGDERISRGGSVASLARSLRSAARSSLPARRRILSTGLRLVRRPP